MPNPNITPLAQDFAIAARVPDPGLYFFHDPNLARLDDGALLIAAPEWGRRHTNLGRSLRIVRSTDGGKTWDDLPTLPYEEGRPFVVDGQLLMFVQERSHGDFQIVASHDRGETWTAPHTVLPGPIWNISTAPTSTSAGRARSSGWNPTRSRSPTSTTPTSAPSTASPTSAPSP